MPPRRRSARLVGQKRTRAASIVDDESPPKRECPSTDLRDRHALFGIPALTQLIVLYGEPKDQLIWAHVCPRELPHAIQHDMVYGDRYADMVQIVHYLCTTRHWDIAAYAVRTWTIQCMSYVTFEEALRQHAWNLVRAFIEVDIPSTGHILCALEVPETPDWVFDYLRQYHYRFPLSSYDGWPIPYIARLRRCYLIDHSAP